MHGNRAASEVSHLYDCWKQYLGQTGYDPEGIDKELEMIHFIPEDRVRSLLETAGFSEVTPFYKAFLFGGWFARAGSGPVPVVSGSRR